MVSLIHHPAGFVSAGLPVGHRLLPDAGPLREFSLRQPGTKPGGPEVLAGCGHRPRHNDWQTQDLRQPGLMPRPGSVSPPLPAPDGARVDTEHFGQSVHAEALSLAMMANQPT